MNFPLRAFKQVSALVALAYLALFALTACHRSTQTILTVSAAASLTDAIQEIEAGYSRTHPGIELRTNLGSSGTLAREIENGAPVDLFISAASKPMDELQSRGLIVTGTRVTLLRNTLVLVVPAGSKLRGFDQLTEPSVKKIALGDPSSVPAGQYGQQVLTAMHVLEGVRSKLVLAKDVRQVLAYVETGNADAGIVYATDAAITSNVRVAATAPETSHDPIVYPAVVLTGTHDVAAAKEFVEYLRSAPAKAIFVKRGFTMAEE